MLPSPMAASALSYPTHAPGIVARPVVARSSRAARCEAPSRVLVFLFGAARSAANFRWFYRNRSPYENTQVSDQKPRQPRTRTCPGRLARALSVDDTCVVTLHRVGRGFVKGGPWRLRRAVRTRRRTMAAR